MEAAFYNFFYIRLHCLTNSVIFVNIYVAIGHIPSTRSYILNIQGNNFRRTSPNIAETSKRGQTTASLKNNFHESHNLNDDLDLTILQNNIKTAAARRYHQDKWICKLKTLAPHVLNTETSDYAKEMYYSY